jgi:hypothetical protein
MTGDERAPTVASSMDRVTRSEARALSPPLPEVPHIALHLIVVFIRIEV